MAYTILKNCYLLFARPEADGIVHGDSVLINGETIEYIGSFEKVTEMIGDNHNLKVIDCGTKLVLPGLIDGHNHLCNTHMNLSRIFSMDYDNIADHQMTTVHGPYGWHDDISLYDISLCSAVNAIKHGTTTIANCTILPHVAYEAMRTSEVRGILAPQIATSFRLKADALGVNESLDLTEDCIKKYHRPDDNFSVVVHIHDTWDCLDEVILQAYQLAETYNTKFVTHFYEFPKAAEYEDRLWKHEGGSFEHYMNLGIINARTVLFHGCMLNERRIQLLSEAGASIIHNPDINGTNCGNCAYVPYMLKSGVNVGLGSDCGALDMFGAMKLMLLVHNIMPRKYRKINYETPFYAATLANAKAYDIEHLVGTIEVGKRADIITIDLSHSPELVPLAISALDFDATILFFLFIRSCSGKETCDTIINGRLIREEGEFIYIDEEKIVAKAANHCNAFLPEYSRTLLSGKHYVKRIHPDFITDTEAISILERL